MKPRTYLMGLPVAVTVTDGGEVRLWVDTAEIGSAIRKGDYHEDEESTVPDDIAYEDATAADTEHVSRCLQPNDLESRQNLESVGTVPVLLTDSDDNTIVILAANMAEAERVGGAAVYHDGGVSAWVIPSHGFRRTAKVVKVLRRGGSVSDLHELFTGQAPRAFR
jgi:hypothetical protein